MSVLKCKMCGADLVRTAYPNIFKCEFCGSQQTLSLTDDDLLNTDLNDAEIKDNLIERVFTFLEFGEWQSAIDYANRVLDVDVKSPKAYLGLLLAQNRVNKKEDLKNSLYSFENDDSYKKLLKFGDEALTNELNGYLCNIKENIETKRQSTLYFKGINYLLNAKSENDFKKAIACFEEIPDFKDAPEKAEECRNKEKEYFETTRLFLTEKTKQTRYVTRHPISAGFNHSVALKKDGTAVAVGGNYDGECDLEGWSEILSVSAGFDCSIGLKSNGTVLAVGENNYGECDVENWKDVVSVSTGLHTTAGLKSDGTLVSTGANIELQKAISQWENIAQVAVSNEHIVGLKNDGTVLAVGENDDGRCDVSEWNDIVAIAVGPYHTVGLKSNGNVLGTGRKIKDLYELSSWEDIIAISAGDSHTVGLMFNGTVVATGGNEYGQCDVYNWKNIVTISAGAEHTLGLKADGTVVATGNNEYGQCDVSTFTDILKTPKSKIASDIFNKAEEEERIKAERQKKGLCEFCGGELKGLFTKKCVKCGRTSTY